MSNETIAVIGGTGKLGMGLARRLAIAGHRVVIGSRSKQSAESAAGELGHGVTGQVNAEAVAGADVVIVSVPFAAQESTLVDIAPHVKGKIVVDTTVPLVPPKVMRVQMPPEGCAALRAQNLLGEEVRVVSAFHNVAANKLMTDAKNECDVLVFSDDAAARQRVVSLANKIQLRGVQGGALANSVAAEALTSVLIFLNKTYQPGEAGIRITGVSIPSA
jgi:NADPH-dependent F420 reductase